MSEGMMGAQELEEGIEAYFARCSEAGARPTLPGLCAAVGLTREDWELWLAEGQKKYPKGKENPYAGMVWPMKRAVLRMADALEQRTDTMARFLLRQSCYGGYSEKEETPGGGELKITVRFGGSGRKECDGYGS